MIHPTSYITKEKSPRPTNDHEKRSETAILDYKMSDSKIEGENDSGSGIILDVQSDAEKG